MTNARTSEAARYPRVNYTDASPHQSAFAHVNGVSLNYLDWGGDGPALVMMHGIGDDPHVFDDLASLLHDRFRIIAYARRGHGLSDAPAGPYDAATLAEDFRRLVDHLGIQRMSVLGWSMGGNEGTAYAGQYPERVDRLIYLDGGYDWSTPVFFQAFGDILAANSPAADMRSLDAVRTWYHKAWLGKAVSWTPGLEAYIRDVAQPDAVGTLHLKPNDQASAAVFATLGNWKRDYTKVQAPTLALYATTFFPLDRSDPALVQQKLRDFNQNIMLSFRQASMERVQRELRNVTVKQIADRNHMTIGLQQPEAVAAPIREFLLTSPPR